MTTDTCFSHPVAPEVACRLGSCVGLVDDDAGGIVAYCSEATAVELARRLNFIKYGDRYDPADSAEHCWYVMDLDDDNVADFATSHRDGVVRVIVSSRSLPGIAGVIYVLSPAVEYALTAVIGAGPVPVLERTDP